MPAIYRRPGVYLEESLLVNPSDVASTITVATFVGVAEKGPINDPVRCESWNDYVTTFGNFDPIPYQKPDGSGGYDDFHALSYLPFTVYSFFQNGGRTAWIIRAVSVQPTEQGTHASKTVNGSDDAAPDLTAFDLMARSVGTWGNTISYELATQDTVNTGTVPAPILQDIFAMRIFVRNSQGRSELVESFSALSMIGNLPGTRRVDSVINDPSSGSRYVMIGSMNPLQTQPEATSVATPLEAGVDPNIPSGSDLVGAVTTDQINKIEGPLTLNIAGYLADATTADTIDMAESFVGGTVPSTSFQDRQDVFIINDNCPPREPNVSSSVYKGTVMASNALGANATDSYSASYGPWLIVPHPARVGTTVSIPPGGAVCGMIARIDTIIGVFRAPAGIVAGLTNAVGVQTKFTETEQGDLNAANINVIRSVVGAGICVMGGRTRKSYGADRYVSARRTLIYLKEVLKRSTQFAVFENNDSRLWAGLRMAAERVLRPLWEAGGLAGANTSQAYYITCDGTINTPQVVQSGEVRMEIGVALEYPAEFVIIRLTQFDRGTFTNEIQPVA